MWHEYFCNMTPQGKIANVDKDELAHISFYQALLSDFSKTVVGSSMHVREMGDEQ